MLPSYFAIIAAGISSLGSIFYLYQTIKGNAQPNRVTWILWAIFPVIVFFAQNSQNTGVMTIITLSSGVFPILIVTASFFNKKAYWKTKPFDYACLVLAIIGMILWYVSKDANVAIIFAILADGLAAAPTIKKAYLHPNSESWQAYSLSTLGFFVGILAIQKWDFANYALVIYLFAVNFLIAILAAKNKRKYINSIVLYFKTAIIA